MHPRKKRFFFIVLGIIVLATVVSLVSYALKSNIALYILPSDVLAGKAPQGKIFRIGGMVKEGSVQRQADGVSISFAITDGVKDVVVTYKGILPDLFKEGKGVVAQGQLSDISSINFVASEVLAKHDENYMPPEAAAAMLEAQKRKNTTAAPPALNK